MRQKRATPRRSGRVRDRAYLLAVKQLPCLVGHDCLGAVQAHHAGQHPLGRKADDDTAVPLCDHHHRCLHDAAGLFEGMGRRWLRLVMDTAILQTRAKVGYQRAA